MSLPRKLARFLPFGLGMVTLALLLWSAGLLARHPHLGADWLYTTGRVTKVYAHTPADTILKTGDRILRIDGAAVFEARSFPEKQAGEIVRLEVERQGRVFEVWLPLASPTFEILFFRLEVTGIALMFWLLGLLVIVFGESGKAETLFFLFCQALSAVLGCGSVSSFGPLWTAWAFRLLLVWGGPLAMHAHCYFPSPGQSQRYGRTLPVLYGLALGMTLMSLLGGMWKTPFFRILVFLFLAFNLSLLMVLVFHAYRSDKSLETRKKLVIILLSALLGFLPVLGLSILPEALLSQTILPYNLSFLSLAVIPAGYGYAILGRRLIRLERTVNRSAAYAFAAILIGIVYGLVSLKAFPDIFSRDRPLPWEWLTLNLILILAAYPLYKGLIRIISRLFYGGWVDDRAAVRQISQALCQSGGDLHSSAKTLCQTLQRTLQLEYANLLLKDGELLSSDDLLPAPRQVVNAAGILNHLHSKPGKEIGGIGELPADMPLDAESYARIVGRKPQLWLLLSTNLQPLGLIVLGYQRGNKPFEPEDLETLEVILRQARVALENAVLLEEIRQRSDTIRHLHYRLLQTREEERKRVSRDLHDQIIQSLIALNYRLSELRPELNEKTLLKLAQIRHELRQILRDVRQICTELRPPALDALGLVQTLEARIAELDRQGFPGIQFRVSGKVERDFPEAVSLCLYRVFQEAMQNVLKHADANVVDVHLQITQDDITLSIQDDGQGFAVPQPLSVLAQTRHYGLIGLQELVESVQGRLEICTAPGRGCRISASIPWCEDDAAQTPAKTDEDLSPAEVQMDQAV